MELSFLFQPRRPFAYTAVLLRCSVDRNTVANGSVHFIGRSTPSCQGLVSGSQTCNTISTAFVRRTCYVCKSLLLCEPYLHRSTLSVRSLIAVVSAVFPLCCARALGPTSGVGSCLCLLGVAYRVCCSWTWRERPCSWHCLFFSFPFTGQSHMSVVAQRYITLSVTSWQWLLS